MNKRIAVFIGLYTVFAIGLGLSLMYYFDRIEADTSVQEESSVADISQPSSLQAGADDATIIAHVGRHIRLSGETPKVVTITGAAELAAEQAFFSLASDGDIILVYHDKVILYDPDKDIIIDVAHIRPEVAGEATDSAQQQLTP